MPDETNTSPAQTATTRAKAVSSSEWWAFWSGVWAVGLTAAAALAGVASWYFSIKVSAESRSQTQAMELKISGQQERAATAERQLLELQQRLANRRITAEQRQRMLSILKSVQRVRPIALEWSPTPEASAFGQDIMAVLRDAGWPVTASAVIASTPSAGLVIETSTLDFDTAKLQEALKSAGYDCAVALTSGYTDRWVLTVGSRP